MFDSNRLALSCNNSGNAIAVGAFPFMAELRKACWVGATAAGSLWIASSGNLANDAFLTASSISGAVVQYISGLSTSHLQITVSGAGSNAAITAEVWGSK